MQGCGEGRGAPSTLVQRSAAPSAGPCSACAWATTAWRAERESASKSAMEQSRRVTQSATARALPETSRQPNAAQSAKVAPIRGKRMFSERPREGVVKQIQRLASVL